MRITKDQLKFLQDFDESTAREVQKAAKDLGSDVLDVNPDSLKMAFRQLFLEWVESFRAMGEEEPPAPSAPPAPAPAVSTSPELNDDLAREQKARREQAEANRKAIEQAAQARVVYYIREEGLLADNDDQDNYNLNLIMNWFAVNKAPFTAHNVDLAVSQLAGQIRWAVWSPRRNSVVAESAQAEPQETLLTKYPKKEDLVKKIRSFNSREEREKFFDRWGGLAKINERLAQPDQEAVSQ